MISTRQLIFIINIVFFFVNPAISGGNRGNKSTSSSSYGAAGTSQGAAEGSSFRPAGRSQCFKFLFFGKKKNTFNDDESINDEYTINENTNDENANKDDTSQHLEFCKYELYVAFQKERAFDNFMYAFLYLKNAEFFKKRSIYTYATAEYYYDLLCTAHEMNKPYLMNPHDFCENRYINDEEDCLRSIAQIGCGAYVDGIICVNNLYFNLNIDEFLLSHNLKPITDTENISDEDLTRAITRGTENYPNLSGSDLLARLSDTNIAKEYYKNVIMKDAEFERLHLGESSEASSSGSLYETNTEFGRRHYEEHRRRNRRRDRHNHDNSPEYDRDGIIVNERHYLPQARSSFYGINIPYYKLYREHTRRQCLLRKFNYQYVMYLHEQLQQSDKSQFKNREQFCTTFLSFYPKYYLYLNLSV